MRVCKVMISTATTTLPHSLTHTLTRTLTHSLTQSHAHFTTHSRGNSSDKSAKNLEQLLGGLDSSATTSHTHSATHSLTHSTTNVTALPSATQKKLNTGLDTKKKRPMDSFEIGMLETRSAEILDILTHSLESKLVYGIFPDIPDTSKVISFNHVKSNRDMTQVSVVWNSDLFLDFIHQVSLKYGENESQLLEKKMFKKITTLLQTKEAKFRTYLMRNMSFRRVPRLTFLPPGNELSREQKYDKQMDEWEKEEALKKKIRRRWERDNKTRD